ncbi:MAG: phosphate/phosphite/phosphonate ABC transporter substrate-binding protein [Desulfobulbaceae bacterium]|nr:phosphate/phosphite/phosphonate ABC transporter substrate-binding protein [Desulfobulbaceae bacterium]
MKKKNMVLGFVLVSILLAFNVQAEQTYVFGVHPFKSPTKLKTMFAPLVDYLSEQLGAKVEFRSARDYDTAMDNLINGVVHFSYLGPSGVAILDEQNPGKIRIAAAVANKGGDPTFRGVIVTREDSAINSLADLQGKRFAFGDRESTLSCYMPAYMLMQAGVFDSMTYEFLNSHTNVAKGVLNGTFAAGGLKPGVAKEFEGKGLKVIATSEPVYEHVIVIGPNVDQATGDKVQQALLNVKDPKVYTSIKGSLEGFALVQASDYDNLKIIMREVDAKIPQTGK